MPLELSPFSVGIQAGKMSSNTHRVGRILTDTHESGRVSRDPGGQKPGRVGGGSLVIRRPADFLEDPLVDLHTIRELAPHMGEVVLFLGLAFRELA